MHAQGAPGRLARGRSDGGSFSSEVLEVGLSRGSGFCAVRGQLGGPHSAPYQFTIMIRILSTKTLKDVGA